MNTAVRSHLRVKRKPDLVFILNSDYVPIHRGEDIHVRSMLRYVRRADENQWEARDFPDRCARFKAAELPPVGICASPLFSSYLALSIYRSSLLFF